MLFFLRRLAIGSGNQDKPVKHLNQICLLRIVARRLFQAPFSAAFHEPSCMVCPKINHPAPKHKGTKLQIRSPHGQANMRQDVLLPLADPWCLVRLQEELNGMSEPPRRKSTT
jgi:hypothetical protein